MYGKSHLEHNGIYSLLVRARDVGRDPEINAHPTMSPNNKLSSGSEHWHHFVEKNAFEFILGGAGAVLLTMLMISYFL